MTAPTPADSEPVCSLCSKPVLVGQAALFRDATTLHLGCASLDAMVRAIDAQVETEAHAATARAARVAETAWQVAEKGRRYRAGDVADPPTP